MDAVIAHLDANQDLYVERLRQWVAIQSVSSNADLRPQVVRMVEHVKSELETLGCQTELKPLGPQVAPFDHVQLPPVLLAKLGDDPKKRNLCIYGHLDVQPAAKSDGWDSEPFELFEKDGRMFGRGSSDDKGPVLGWLNVVEAFKKCNVEIPVNLRFVFEGMEESGSEGLAGLLQKEKDTFFKDSEFVCVSDSYWESTNTPCLSYGLRGIAYFFLTVECAGKDLHSGMYGGAVSEAMTDLVKIMTKLIDDKGKILIPGIDEMVAALTEKEAALYRDIDFDEGCFGDQIGVELGKLKHSGKEKVLMSVWRYPSLSFHGIEGAFSDPGCKTVIPRKVVGKFSIRLVPDLTVEKTVKCVEEYIAAESKKLGSPNKIKVEFIHGGEPWVSDFDAPNYRAGAAATEAAYGVKPDLVRSGGSIPIVVDFDKILGKSVLLLPMGACDDAAHSQNEKLDKRNYFSGMKMFAHYFQQIALLPK